VTETARRLIDGYRSELDLYARLLALARGEEAASGVRSVDRTLACLREKARILEEIGRLEADLAPLKEIWVRERGCGPSEEIAELNQVLERIAAVLEETLALEGTLLQRFALLHGLGGARAPLVPASRLARYGEEDGRDACVSVRG
jgi:hypothetical protein